MSGPIYNAVRHSNGGGSTAVRQVSPTGTNFSGTTANSIVSKAALKDATRHRKGFAVFTACLFAAACVLLLLVNLGNVANVAVLRDLFFFRIDVSKLVPGGGDQTTSAQSIGLKDFYQVGLWNFCEGTNDKGITSCSKPILMYWFNPVQIMVEEVLNGEKVSLPQDVVDYLTTVRNASHLMFGCFFATTLASFAAVFLAPMAVYSRLASIPIAIFVTLTALATLVAAATASAMWAVLRRSVNEAAGDLSVVPTVGTKMAILSWVAAGLTLLAAFGQLCLMCCGTSRRDIKTGRRVGRRQRQEKVAVEENPALRRRWWGSVSQ